MYSQKPTSKDQKTTGRAVANAIAQKKAKEASAVSFMDNRKQKPVSKASKSLQLKTPNGSSGANDSAPMQFTKTEKLKDGFSKTSAVQGSLLSGALSLGAYSFLGGHPIGWIVGGLVGGIAATGAISYFKGIDIDSLAGVAARLGMTEQQLITHWNTSPPAPTTVYNYAQQIPEAYQVRAFKSTVPPFMTANLKGNNKQKLNTIFARLNAMPFHYSGTLMFSTIGYLTKSGDCYTLAEMFKQAAEAAGIQGVTIKSSVHDQIVLPRPIHGRTNRGNTEQDRCWFFGYHYWCDYNGQAYDLLFMTKQKVTSYKKTATQSFKGCSYMVFSNGYCFIDKHEAKQKLGKNFASSGICKKNEKQIKAYILKNKPRT